MLGVLPGANTVLDPGMHPVSRVEVGGSGAPTRRLVGKVVTHSEYRQPSSTSNQAQLDTPVGALAAGEDPHARRPAGELVCARALAQQPGQLGDVRLLTPAPLMPTPAVLAGVLGATLPHRPAVIDRDLPGALGHPTDRRAVTSPQIPTHRAGQLTPGPGGELIQAGDQPMTAPSTIARHHQLAPRLRWQRRDRVPPHPEVIDHRVRARTAAAHHPGQRLARVVTLGQQGMMARFQWQVGW